MAGGRLGGLPHKVPKFLIFQKFRYTLHIALKNFIKFLKLYVCFSYRPPLQEWFSGPPLISLKGIIEHKGLDWSLVNPMTLIYHAIHA